MGLLPSSLFGTSASRHHERRVKACLRSYEQLVQDVRHLNETIMPEFVVYRYEETQDDGSTKSRFRAYDSSLPEKNDASNPGVPVQFYFRLATRLRHSSALPWLWRYGENVKIIATITPTRIFERQSDEQRERENNPDAAQSSSSSSLPSSSSGISTPLTSFSLTLREFYSLYIYCLDSVDGIQSLRSQLLKLERPRDWERLEEERKRREATKNFEWDEMVRSEERAEEKEESSSRAAAASVTSAPSASSVSSSPASTSISASDSELPPPLPPIPAPGILSRSSSMDNSGNNASLLCLAQPPHECSICCRDDRDRDGGATASSSSSTASLPQPPSASGAIHGTDLMMLRCMHSFCESCLTSWRESCRNRKVELTCPLCARPLSTEEQEESQAWVLTPSVDKTVLRTQLQRLTTYPFLMVTERGKRVRWHDIHPPQPMLPPVQLPVASPVQRGANPPIATPIATSTNASNDSQPSAQPSTSTPPDQDAAATDSMDSTYPQHHSNNTSTATQP